MDRVIERVVQAVLGLQGLPAYSVIGLLTFAEAAAFLGLVAPGEISMVLGGVLVTQGGVSLSGMLMVAVAAAILGDSSGYWLGRLWGARVLSWDPIQRRLGDKVDRARQRFREKGGWTVAAGRWASVLRSFVPFVAGSSKMPYPRFLLYSAPSAALWAACFVLLGYIAGQSWYLIQRYAGQASMVLLLVIVIGLLVRWLAGLAMERQDELRDLLARVADARLFRWLRRRYGQQLRWLGRRFDPQLARGLGLTVGFALLAAGAVVAGMVLQDVRGFEGVALLDFPVARWFALRRTPAALEVARVLLRAFEPPWGVLPVSGVAAYAAWRNDPRAGARVVIGALGAAAASWVVQHLVTERVAGTQFPSLPVAVAAALLNHAITIPGHRGRWAVAVRTAAVGTFVVALVALAGLLAGDAALTGVLFGAALGIGWAAAVEVQARLPFRTSTQQQARAAAGRVD